MPKKIMLLGSKGQLGQTLIDQGLGSQHQLTALSRQELDITDSSALTSELVNIRPDILINASAYTAVDAAESNQDLAWAVNATALEAMAQWAAAENSLLIHLSTDFVFDGSHNQPYHPGDETSPLGVYGKSKLAGERVLANLSAANSCIIRTAWLYSPFGNNFVKTMLRLMAERESLNVVDDQVGTPCSTFSLTRCLAAVVDSPQAGIYHWSDAGTASWYDFAVAIQEEALALGLLGRAIPINPIPSAAYPTPARRPAYSVLDKRDTTAAFGCEPRHWRIELRTVLARLQTQD